MARVSASRGAIKVVGLGGGAGASLRLKSPSRGAHGVASSNVDTVQRDRTASTNLESRLLEEAVADLEAKLEALQVGHGVAPPPSARQGSSILITQLVTGRAVRSM